MNGFNVGCISSHSKAFRNVLVVIQFTVIVRLDIVHDLHKLYSCFLPNIRMYSYCDKSDSKLADAGMRCLARPQGNLPRYFNPSYYQYEFMAHAMETEPDFEGYIFMQDDVILNFWNFLGRHNFTKLWRADDFPNPLPDVWKQYSHIPVDNPNAASASVMWGLKYFGVTGPMLVNFVNGFSAQEQQRLFSANSNSTPPQRHVRMASCDMYYIPQQYRAAILPHMKRAREQLIFQEIAVPMIFDAVVPQHDHEIAPGAALDDGKDSAQKMALYNPCWDFYHKMKPGIHKEWVFIVETVLMYGKMMHHWHCHDNMGAQGLTSFDRIS